MICQKNQSYLAKNAFKTVTFKCLIPVDILINALDQTRGRALKCSWDINCSASLCCSTLWHKQWWEDPSPLSFSGLCYPASVKKKPRGTTGCSDAFQSKRCKKKKMLPLAQLLLQHNWMSSSRSKNSVMCYLLAGCCNHALTFQRKVVNFLKCGSNNQTGQLGSYFIIWLPQNVKVNAVFCLNISQCTGPIPVLLDMWLLLNHVHWRTLSSYL